MPTQLSEFAKLKIIGGKLYFDGQPVVTGIRLEGWTLGAAWFAGGAAAIGAIGNLLAYADPIAVALHLKQPDRISYVLVERDCETEIHEHYARAKVETIRITHPCQQKTSAFYPK